MRLRLGALPASVGFGKRGSRLERWLGSGLQRSRRGQRVGCVGGHELGERLDTEVAASYGPLIVLFGEDAADQADNGRVIRARL
jgi:hypothetical protein